MSVCPKCASPNVTLTDGSVWTAHCETCGHDFGGTASFPHFNAEQEPYCDLSIHLESVTQIPSVRSMVVEISNVSAADLLKEARANELKIAVRSILTWRAIQYREAADRVGIKIIIQK